jgi:EAL domain-containing protein (putative c-di-GMP-specific phosphodiesterase class I)
MSLGKARRDNLKLSVKLSLATISDPEFVPWLKDLLNQAELPPGRLMLEIETPWFVRGQGHYQPLMEGIGRFFDIKFVLSGINKIEAYYLVRKHQRFDFIKLNVKDLVYGFPRGPLYELINAVRKDDTRIVAINVADAETLNMATNFNIDYVHGYLVGRPFTDVMTDAEGDLHCVL